MEDNRGERFDSWTSYSDMFCSLLMVFMLLFFYAMIQYSVSSLNDTTKMIELQAEHEQQTEQLKQSFAQVQGTLEETELELGIAQADMVAGLVRIDALEDEILALQTSLQERDGIILQRDSEISDLREELENALHTGEILRTELSASWSELAAGEEAFKELEDGYAAQTAALAAEIDTLTDQNAARAAEAGELLERCAELEAQASGLAVRNEALQIEVEELTSRCAVLETQAADLAARHAGYGSDAQLAEAEISALQAENARLEAELVSRQEQLDELEAQYRTAVMKEQSASQTVGTIQTSLSAVQAQNAELTAANASLEEQLAALVSEGGKMQLLIGNQGIAKDAQQAALEDLAGIRTEIISKVSETLRSNGVTAYVDAKDGSIALDSQLLFRVNRAELSSEGKAFLRSFFPVYFEALMSPEARDHIAQIVVEGHTDTTGSYLSNLDLSLRRAQAVAEYCIGLFEDERQLQLTKLICACGCSYSNPVLAEDGSVDMDGSRRVEIKFSLKDEYMVEKIRDIIEE